MARGWESKAVEQQISDREAEAEAPKKQSLTPLELQRRSRREGLLLVRSRTLNALQSATSQRYRALLERALADLDAQLAQQ